MARLCVMSGGGSTAPSSTSSSSYYKSSEKDDHILSKLRSNERKRRKKNRRNQTISSSKIKEIISSSNVEENVLSSKIKEIIGPDPRLSNSTNASSFRLAIPQVESVTVHSKNQVESIISRSLNFPYYAFLLYHTGNKRLDYFINNHLDTIDRISGKNFLIFTLSKSTKKRLVIDEILADKSVNDSLINFIREWRKYTPSFSIDKSFDIAEAIGLSRRDVPCLIIYPTETNSDTKAAILRLKDDWFPKGTNDIAGYNETIEWFGELFDNLSHIISTKAQEDTIVIFQKYLTSLARRKRFLLTIRKFIKFRLKPIINLPFSIIAVLPSLAEKLASEKIKTLMEGENDNNK